MDNNNFGGGDPRVIKGSLYFLFLGAAIPYYFLHPSLYLSDPDILEFGIPLNTFEHICRFLATLSLPYIVDRILIRIYNHINFQTNNVFMRRDTWVYISESVTGFMMSLTSLNYWIFLRSWSHCLILKKNDDPCDIDPRSDECLVRLSESEPEPIWCAMAPQWILKALRNKLDPCFPNCNHFWGFFPTLIYSLILTLFAVLMSFYFNPYEHEPPCDPPGGGGGDDPPSSPKPIPPKPVEPNPCPENKPSPKKHASPKKCPSCGKSHTDCCEEERRDHQKRDDDYDYSCLQLASKYIKKLQNDRLDNFVKKRRKAIAQRNLQNIQIQPGNRNENKENNQEKLFQDTTIAESIKSAFRNSLTVEMISEPSEQGLVEESSTTPTTEEELDLPESTKKYLENWHKLYQKAKQKQEDNNSSGLELTLDTIRHLNAIQNDPALIPTPPRNVKRLKKQTPDSTPIRKSKRLLEKENRNRLIPIIDEPLIPIPSPSPKPKPNNNKKKPSTVEVSKDDLCHQPRNDPPPQTDDDNDEEGDKMPRSICRPSNNYP